MVNNFGRHHRKNAEIVNTHYRKGYWKTDVALSLENKNKKYKRPVSIPCEQQPPTWAEWYHLAQLEFHMACERWLRRNKMRRELTLGPELNKPETSMII